MGTQQCPFDRGFRPSIFKEVLVLLLTVSLAGSAIEAADQVDKGWWDKTCDSAKAAADKTKDMAAKAKDATGDAAAAAWNATADAAGKAKDAAAEAAKKAKAASCDTAATAWNATAEAAGKAKDAAADAAQKATKASGEAVTAAWNSAGAAASETARKARNAYWDSIDAYRGNRYTLEQLRQGRYVLLPSEQVLLDKCGELSDSIGIAKPIPAGEDEGLAKARKLMAEDKLQAAIEQYARWQEDWLAKAPKAPPLDQVKEALLAPSTAFAFHYLRARRQIRGLSKDDQDKYLKQLAIEQFRNPIAGRLAGDSRLPETDGVKNVLAAASTALILKPTKDEGKFTLYDCTLGLEQATWVAIKTTKTTQDADNIYDKFSISVLDAYGKDQHALVENKALFLLLKDLLEDKERADKQLEAILSSRLLTPEQVADMKRFREAYRALYDQYTHLVCLYYVDMPLRVKILCVNLEVDKAKGWKDNDEQIMSAGVGLAGIVQQLRFFADSETLELYWDLWRRFKGELGDKDITTLETKAKFVPDWMKTIGVKDIAEATQKPGS